MGSANQVRSLPFSVTTNFSQVLLSPTLPHFFPLFLLTSQKHTLLEKKMVSLVLRSVERLKHTEGNLLLAI